MPTTSVRRLISPLRRSIGLVLWNLARCSRWEVHVGEDVLLGGVHQGGQLRHLGAELVGHRAPLGVGGRGILLGIGGADPGRDDAALGLPGMGRCGAAEMDAAALPGRPQHLGHRGLEPLMRVGDDQLHAAQAAAGQASAGSPARTSPPRRRRPPCRGPRGGRRALTPTAMVTATGTMRPASRTFT